MAPSKSAGLLEDIVQSIVEHNMANPSHGRSCSCMDEYVRRVRVMLTGLDVATQGRMRHILRIAGRW